MFAIGQTYKSSRIATAEGLKREAHTIILKDSTITFDGVRYSVYKKEESFGTIKSTTYTNGKGVHFRFIYKRKKCLRIFYHSRINGVTKTTVCHKPKIIKKCRIY